MFDISLAFVLMPDRQLLFLKQPRRERFVTVPQLRNLLNFFVLILSLLYRKLCPHAGRAVTFWRGPKSNQKSRQRGVTPLESPL